MLIWFEYIWFDLETHGLIWFQLMWFDLWCHQITDFSNLGQRVIATVWHFTAMNYCVSVCVCGDCVGLSVQRCSSLGRWSYPTVSDGGRRVDRDGDWSTAPLCLEIIVVINLLNRLAPPHHPGPGLQTLDLGYKHWIWGTNTGSGLQTLDLGYTPCTWDTLRRGISVQCVLVSLSIQAKWVDYCR